jgi:small subunit ribosomal protein S14
LSVDFGGTIVVGRVEVVAVATQAWMAKARMKPKFPVRRVNRCQQCGRARAFLRKFKLCRICFRQMALEGQLPGVTKASW